MLKLLKEPKTFPKLYSMKTLHHRSTSSILWNHLKRECKFTENRLKLLRVILHRSRKAKR